MLPRCRQASWASAIVARSIYLINPTADFASYYGAEVFRHCGLPAAAFVADLSITTVAAMIPADFSVELCDEIISPVELDKDADFIGITGKSSQQGRMLQLADEFRRRGKTVILGGPVASLSPDWVRPHCDILVTGELENIADQLFADLRRGTYMDTYHGTAADMARSPAPRWNIYPHQRALQGCLQTSRGCPFQCDFCDTIQYVGRHQRHKPVQQVLDELQRLYTLGFRAVFLADDNFTAHRPKARELLQALQDWNAQAPAGRVWFSTQLSIDAAKHPDLLELCANAGLIECFVGIETNNAASLQQAGKRQNLGEDPLARLDRFVASGVGVVGGLMVGFDADECDIFENLFDFAMQSPVPTFSVNALNAPPTTPLHERMERQGRLVSDGSEFGPVTPWWTNIQPARMSRKELQRGLIWLVNRLYQPAAFEQRMARFIERFDAPYSHLREPGTPLRQVNLQAVSVVRAIVELGTEEHAMLKRLSRAARAKPAAQRHLFANLFRYTQIRHLYGAAGMWNPELGWQESPF